MENWRRDEEMWNGHKIGPLVLVPEGGYIPTLDKEAIPTYVKTWQWRWTGVLLGFNPSSASQKATRNRGPAESGWPGAVSPGAGFTRCSILGAWPISSLVRGAFESSFHKLSLLNRVAPLLPC
jgi:hypothetical protein